MEAAEPPAAAQPAPPSQQPSAALVAAARASLDASELQDARGSKRDALARTPPSASALERPPPPADARKKSASRGGRQLEAALACAAPAAEPEVHEWPVLASICNLPHGIYKSAQFCSADYSHTPGFK